MKKSKKILLRILPAFMFGIMLLCNGCVFADINPADPNGGTAISNVTQLGKDVWATIRILVQIAAIAAIVFAGVRYMFASADQKADIKKQTVVLIVGAVLVFAAVPVATFIQNAAKS